jgi:hypothetical protein
MNRQLIQSEPSKNPNTRRAISAIEPLGCAGEAPVAANHYRLLVGASQLGQRHP